MADQHTYKILPEDKCLSESQLFDYIDGKLKASDMHFIEKHILSCGFCSDALEGLEKVKDRQKVAGFIPIAAAVEKEEKKEEPKVIPLNPNRKYYAIAAGAVLILGVTLLLKLSTSNDLAESKLADVNDKRKSDSAVLMPAKDAQDKSIVAFDSNTLKQEKYSTVESENKQAVASGEVVRPDYFKSKVTDEAGAAEQNAAPAPKIQEPVQFDKLMEIEDADDFANVVDAKAPKEEQLAKTKTAKEKPGKLTLAEKKNAANRSDNDDDNKKDQQNDHVVVANEDVPVTLTQASGSSTTITTPSPTNTWNGPTSTTNSGATSQTGTYNSTVSDTTTVVTKTERDLDLSYENGNKMLAAGQATASIALYDEVLKNPAHPHYQDAQWKKSEALIQLKRTEEAKKLLNEIASKPGKYKEQAKEKLKTL